MADGPQATDRKSSAKRGEIVELIPALRAFSRTFYRNTSDADDLVQETLTRALTSLHQFQQGTSMKSWLFTIMRNAFYTRVKRARRETTGAAECASLRPATDATQEWSQRGREIAEAIQRLPADQREVIMLIGVLGVSYEEAVGICGCAIGTVKSRLNRARARLLKELEEASTAALVERSDPFPVSSLEGQRRYG